MDNGARIRLHDEPMPRLWEVLGGELQTPVEGGIHHRRWATNQPVQNMWKTVENSVDFSRFHLTLNVIVR